MPRAVPGSSRPPGAGVQPPLPRRTPLATQCADVIRAGCRDGRWAAHLPAERKLSAEFQVGRLTLRKALLQLAGEGLLRIAHGKPTRIVRSVRAATAKSRPALNVVGLVTPKPLAHLRPFVTLWIDYLRSELQAAGCVLKVHEGEKYYQQDPGFALQDLVRSSPHAAWLLYLTNRPIQQWVARERLPAIVIGYAFPELDLPFVAPDMHAVCRHAANRMLALGHRRILFLRPDAYGPGDWHCEQGFLEAFATGLGRRAEPRMAAPPESAVGLVRFMTRLLKDHAPPTAILVARTAWYFTIHSYLLSAGVRVPEQISLVARDDESFLGCLYPPATRYSFNARTFARKMAGAALAVVHGQIPARRRYLILPHLISGGTLGPAPGAVDPPVSNSKG